MAAPGEAAAREIGVAGRVADAVPGNWVDGLAPLRWRPYLRLSRMDRPVGTWLLLIPCLWGLGLAAAHDGGFRPHDLWLVLSATIGAFLMRGAGCTWNDVTDRDIDAAVARTRSRPIPAGEVGVRGALVWMVAQALLAALILVTYTPLAIALGVASLALVAVYPFAKRFTWWPQAFLGLAFNWGILVMFAAHTGTLSYAVLPLYGAGIAWTLFYDTIYAHQDREDDALIGVRSTARLFGAATKPWLAGFALAATGLMALAVLLVPGLPARGTALGLAGCVAFGAHLAWQLRHLRTDDPTGLLQLFRSNREAGLLAALFLAGAALV